MKRKLFFVPLMLLGATQAIFAQKQTSGNPLFPGWYADPDAIVLDKKVWIFPTFSAKYKDQVFLDAFSSPDLVNWTKHPRILDTANVKWAYMAMWAPTIVKNSGKYFLFFSANDIQTAARQNWNGKKPDAVDDTLGGIGVAVADKPEGPYKDYLGKPLINRFYNKAQPIDQCVFQDRNGQWYIIYGGWGRCNIGKLKEDFTALQPFTDGSLVREITPKGYVEGPTMFLRNNKYYLMWSEGNWTDSSYKVAYTVADSITGPFIKKATILTADYNIATGAGHHSVINLPGTTDWYIIYHRRPIPNQGRDHRVVCMDRMYFNKDGSIQEVKMTVEGVQKRKIR